MADKTRIEWTDATWNPITGCTLVSEGCRHCYAARLAATRLQHHPSRKGLARITADGEAKFTGEVRLNEQWLDQPLRWRRPRRVFVCAHGDLFHENVPDEWIDRVFAVMALAPHHTFQVLTKRPARMRAYMGRQDERGRWPALDYAALMSATGRWATPSLDLRGGWPLPNVWLGVSAEDQRRADERIPHLLATPAAVRFVSCEPLLGLIRLNRIPSPDTLAPSTLDALTGKCWPNVTGVAYNDRKPRLDWVIVGGESGPDARPMHPAWARSLRDQCQAAGVPFFFKQWGEWAPGEIWPPRAAKQARLHPNGFHGPGGEPLVRLGKSLAGNALDGRTWTESPKMEPA